MAAGLGVGFGTGIAFRTSRGPTQALVTRRDASKAASATDLAKAGRKLI
jgi:hypothetical protein